jgi:hypothetical protein
MTKTWARLAVGWAYLAWTIDSNLLHLSPSKSAKTDARKESLTTGNGTNSNSSGFSETLGRLETAATRQL